MPPRRSAVPAYRLHKPTGQAVVTVRTPDGRRDVYLGKFGSDASRAEYARILKALDDGTDPATATSPRVVPKAPTVAEILLGFMRHAATYYRRADGTPTDEVGNYRLGVRIVRELYGDLPATEFGPVALKRVRDAMVARGWCRTFTNSQTGRVRRIFRWAAENELVPAGVWHALQAVRGLSAGGSAARETDPIRPAPVKAVALAMRKMPPAVAAMVRLQWLTGCRPQDVCNLRADEIDRSGPTWVFRPAKHKNAHRGKAREVFIGPKAQRVLAPYLTGDPGDGD